MKNDSNKKAEALRTTLELQNSNCAPSSLRLRSSSKRYAKDAAFEQRLSPEEKRLLKDLGIAV